MRQLKQPRRRTAGCFYLLYGRLSAVWSAVRV
nr:MAG TPA: hypothetical protein [Caudoviricetes sp.]